MFNITNTKKIGKTNFTLFEFFGNFFVTIFNF